jgi:sarcosine oxidase, subunit gamma
VTAEALRVSALADLAAAFEAADVTGPRGVRLREIPFLTQLNLRVGLEQTQAVLGAQLPTEPNTVATIADGYVLWLGPDEWLVVGPDDIAPQLKQAADSVVNVSAVRTVLELSGPSAREVLEKGCALDLHPNAFGPGRCAQTLLSRVEVILHQTADSTYRLYVRASFARYLATWLLDAMSEYRHPALEEIA